MSTLIDNINSNYFASYAQLQPKSQPKSVFVYVESDPDIAFWRKILDPYEDDSIKFEVQLPSDSSLTKNKKTALSRSSDLSMLKGLGKHLLICVDSDYDYLLKGLYKCPKKEATAKKINDSIYIFQTYTYSMENLKCFSKGLHSICVDATNNDKKIIDFNNYLKSYSGIVYDLFLWNLLFYIEGRESMLSIKSFSKIIKIGEIKDNDETYGLTYVKGKVDAKMAELTKKHPGASVKLDQLGKDLEVYGLTNENTYLFIQGHALFDNIITNLIKFTCKKLKDEKNNEIIRLSKHREEQRNQIRAYEKIIGNLDERISNLLEYSMNFHSCFLFKKIESDIKKYFDKEILNH